MYLISKLKGSTFLSSVMNLAIGSLIAQAITFLLSPVISRIYSVESLGSYSLVLTIITIFGSTINGKYDYAIIATKDEKDVPFLISLALLFTVNLTAIVGLGLLFTNNYYPALFEDVGNWLYFSLVLLLITGITNVLNAFNTREREYALMSRVYVIRTIMQQIISLLLGFAKFSLPGLLVAQLVGGMAGIRSQSQALRKKKYQLKKLQPRGLFEQLKKYRHYPFYSLPADLMNNLSYALINIFVSSLFGLFHLGIYSMTNRILAMPLLLVGKNVSKVFFKEAAEEYKETNEYAHALKKATVILTIIAIPMVVFLLLFATPIFTLFLGEQWSDAGTYGKILAPMFGLRLIVNGLTPVFMIIKKQHIEAVFQSLFLITLVGNFIGALFIHYPITDFLQIYAISNLIIYVCIYLYIFRKFRLSN